VTQQPVAGEAASDHGAASDNGARRRLVAIPARRSIAGRARFHLHPDVLAVAALVGVLTFLWGRASGGWFWLDEGIAVGISSHPFGSIPDLLRQDGSPPLYYAVLHLWMSLFGSSEVATHILSLLFALAAVPTALWAGWSLSGRRAGWMCALVASVNPFLAYYANETRMYSLVVLLTLVVVTTFVHAFVFGRRRHLIGFTVSLALLLYTHNWGLLVGVGCVVALAVVLVPAGRTERQRTARAGAPTPSADQRRVVLDAVLAFGAVGLLYLPWLPTLLYQHAQDLQPWAQKPTLLLIREQVANLVGGMPGAVALGLGAGVGLAAVLGWPWSREARALVALAVIPIVVVVGGWLTAVFAYRYLAAVVAPVMLFVGLGLARGGRTAVAALGIVAFLTAPIAVKTPPYQKSNAKAVAEEASQLLEPGDLVVSPDPQLPPLFAHYLPSGLRYFTAAGAVPDERIVDWRDSLERLRDGDPADTLPPVLDDLAPGTQVLVVCPPTGAADVATLRQRVEHPEEVDAISPGTLDGLGEGAEGTGTPGEAQTRPSRADRSTAAAVAPQEVPLFHQLIRRRCDETALLVLEDPGLGLERRIDAPPGITWTPVEALVLTKLG
jgi:mannosyltransferase